MNDIRPLKDIVEISGKLPLVPVLVLILAALVIAVFIYFKKNKKAGEKISMPLKSPEDMAREALAALREMRLIENDLVKEYYIRLSDIIRIYIESRYKISAMDKTTWELFQEMKSKRIERLHADKISDFLESCDMVKFAKYIPDRKEMEEAYEKAEEIIDATTPKIEIIKL